MKTVILAGALFALSACSYTPETQSVAGGSEVGRTGNISFTHDQLTQTKHFLSVTAAPGLGETEGSIFQRIHQFSIRFSAQTCPGEFQFVSDPNLVQPTATGFMQRTRSYVFVCA